ncbi:hypothetical protein Tco_1329151 [Tanacetum coccineum]
MLTLFPSAGDTEAIRDDVLQTHTLGTTIDSGSPLLRHVSVGRKTGHSRGEMPPRNVRELVLLLPLPDTRSEGVSADVAARQQDFTRAIIDYLEERVTVSLIHYALSSRTEEFDIDLRRHVEAVYARIAWTSSEERSAAIEAMLDNGWHRGPSMPLDGPAEAGVAAALAERDARRIRLSEGPRGTTQSYHFALVDEWMLQGNYMSDCPKLKNGYQGFRDGNGNAIGWQRAYVVGSLLELTRTKYCHRVTMKEAEDGDSDKE